MRRSSLVCSCLLALSACALEDAPDDLGDRDAELLDVVDDPAEAPGQDAPPSLAVDSEPTAAAGPRQLGPGCGGLPIATCDQTPGCMVDAIGCDPPLCELDPWSGQQICYPCDPFLVCVADNAP